MRIVFLADRIPPFERGGGGKIPWLLAQDFQQLGHEVFVISATSDASYDEVREEIPIYYLRSAYPERWRAWVSLCNPQVIRPLQRLLKQLQPDVVNIHNVHTHLSYASLVIASRLRYPVVFTAHDVMTFAYGKIDYFIRPHTCAVQTEDYRLPFAHNLRENRLRYNPLRNLCIRYILSHYSQARTAVSLAQKAALEANYLPTFEPVVYHGFDLEAPPPVSVMESLTQRLALAGRRVIFLGGRLTVAKGIRQVLEALNQVVLKVPQVTLLTLSSAPFEQSWLAGLEHLKPEHICEGGWLNGEDLLAAYHLADTVLVPSIYLDPQPTITFEALAAGKAPIVTCFGGASEVIQDGETGFVVNPFDVSQFADRLIQLLTDEALREQMGSAAQNYLRQHLTRQQQLGKMLEAYQAAIQVKSKA